MKDEEFRMLLDLTMVSDPFPLGQDKHDILIDMVDDEARRHGYDGWIDAYHRF